MAHGRRPADPSAAGRAGRAGRAGSGPLIPPPAAGPIWLVRHAETAWTGVRWCGRSDPALTAAGRDAAARVAQEIAADHAGRSATGVIVVASPLRRSMETAAAIAGALGVPVQVEPGVAEIDFGDIDGLTWDEVLASHPGSAAAILDGADLDWPGGETAAQVDARARTAAERIRILGRSSAVVVVSHGGFIAVLARHLGAPSAAGGLAPASRIRVDVSPVAAVDIVA